MYIDKFKQPDGSFIDPSGSYYESAEDFLQISTLGFCGCGCPEESLGYVRDVLQHIDNLKQLVWEKKQTYEEWAAEGSKLFSNDGARYFTFYVLDQKELTEHGGSVPGWLTGKGRELLEDLNSILANDQREGRAGSGTSPKPPTL